MAKRSDEVPAMGIGTLGRSGACSSKLDPDEVGKPIAWQQQAHNVHEAVFATSDSRRSQASLAVRRAVPLSLAGVRRHAVLTSSASEFSRVRWCLYTPLQAKWRCPLALCSSTIP